MVSDIHIDDCMDGSYEGEYISAKSGRGNLWLRLGGAHIVGSPFSVNIAPQVPARLACLRAASRCVDSSVGLPPSAQESRKSGPTSSLVFLSSLFHPSPFPRPHMQAPLPVSASVLCLPA